MERLRPSDVDRLLAFLSEIDGVAELSQFPIRALAGLKKLVPADMVGYNEIDTANGGAYMVLDPADSFRALHAEFERVLPQHPVLRYHARTGDGRALSISDFLSSQEFHNLELYQDLFRLIGADDQIAFTIPSRPHLVIGIAANRSRRGFSGRDRRLLDLLRPHLAQAYRNAELRARLNEMVKLLEVVADASGRAIVLIDRNGRVKQATAHAEALFHSYLGCFAGEGYRVPPILDAWIRSRRAAPELERDGAANASVRFQRDGGDLTIRYLGRGEIGEYDALILDEHRHASPGGVSTERLTKREAEVLRLVASGKSNAEVGEILSVSGRTVQKHLEHIYDKLGVRTRTAAALALHEGRTEALRKR